MHVVKAFMETPVTYVFGRHDHTSAYCTGSGCDGYVVN
jgi:hypothetical protein